MKNNSLEKNLRLNLPVVTEEGTGEGSEIEETLGVDTGTEDKEISIAEEMMPLKDALIAIKLGILPGNAQNVRFLLF